MKEVDLHIRRANNLVDYESCVQLQKEVWSFTEPEDLAAVPMLMIANRGGGCVLLAEEPSGRAVGFAFALPGWNTAKKRLWWSHMTAVVPEHRKKNLGFRLKLKQREAAIEEGIDEIHWTFDPLQAVNARFNIHKLGVIVRTYEENIYGTTSSSLHQGLPTDRFVAEWHLNSDRVNVRIGTSEPAVIFRDLDRIPRINGPDREPNLRLDESPLLLEIPYNLTELKTADLAAAREWQSRIRTACEDYFRAGYVVTDFIMVDRPRPQALYVLEKDRG